MTSPATVLAVGRVRRPHGIHGEVVVEIHTDFPDRIKPGIDIGVGGESPTRWLRIHKVRTHKGCWLLAFDGIVDRNDVEDLRDAWVFLPEQERSSLPANYFYEHEIAGLRCVGTDGTSLGTVKTLLPGPGRALLEVITPSGERLVPFTSPIVARVDLEAGVIVLDVPPGLLDDDAL